MSILRRIANLFSRDKVQREIDRELAEHLEMRIEDNLATGMSAREARRAALLRFGNPTVMKERVTSADAALTLESFWADIRYGFRQLRRSPGFTAVTLITLALGIGANTAIFSLINSALLKMLPVHDPQQLVEFTMVDPATLKTNDNFAYPAFLRFRDRNQTLSGVLAFRKLHDIDFEVDGQGGLANGQLVSGSYFTTLGVKAILGRTILPSDESVAGQNPVAVIGYDYWRSRFALDPAIVGKRVVLNNSLFTVVGVTQPEFYGLQPGERIDISVPLTTITVVRSDFAAPGTPYDVLKAPFRNWLYVIGRLQPGVSKERATANLQPLFAQSLREAADSLHGLPLDQPSSTLKLPTFKLQLEPGGQGLAALRQQFSKPLWLIMAVVGLLLLVTCANVANLQLARATTRQPEIGIRLMIGASRLRLMRQLLVENLLLALAGGLLGLGLAYLCSQALVMLLSHARSPIVLSVHPDAAVLGFTIVVSLVTALLFGTIPTWRATQLDMTPALTRNTRSFASTRSRSSVARALVVLQISISLVLIVGAGLLARSLENLKDFYPGFNKDSVLLFSINPQMTGYNEAQLGPLYQRLLDRVQAIPGVHAATYSLHSPLAESRSFTSVNVQGYKLEPNTDLPPTNIEIVGPAYFHTMETPILRGRDFTANDRGGAPRVAVVNETFARLYFGDSNPIGRQISIPGWRGDPSWLTITGIVMDVKFHDLRETSAPAAYLPMLQEPEAGATFELRTAIDPSHATNAALDAVRETDRRLPVFAIKTLGQQLDDSMVEERLVASLSGIFGALALLLAAVGLYGLMAYTVSRRTGEIGIRMALGAERGQISLMVLRETLILVVCGLVIGIPAALGASHLVRSQLYGLKPYDAPTIVVACAIMAAVTLLASYLPAHRAAATDPMQALRME